MREGVLLPNKKDDEIAEFIINTAYPHDVLPISCIETGLKTYGIDPKDISRSYLGIHMMDTWECLEHPKYRTSPQVVHRMYNEDLDELPPGLSSAAISLDSFEMWKFIDLLLRGSYAIYEILYMPVIHHEPGSDFLLELCRSGITSRIGKSAKKMAIHEWRKRKRSRKYTCLTYYRLIQSIFFLREEEFEWDVNALIEYCEPAGIIEFGQELLENYKDKKKEYHLTELEIMRAEKEIDNLVGETDRAMMVTRFPDQFPESVFSNVLNVLKEARSKLV